MSRNCLQRLLRGPLLPALLCVASLLPFADKAYHIDDPLFVWAARHISHHPADFYGFSVNWYFSDMAMWRVTKNPPLACYYLALAGVLFGWSEPSLHLAMLLPAVAAVWGTYRLAERLCARPLLASLVTLWTPAFLVSSTSVMCDTLMVALWVWALVCWMRGLGRGHAGWLLLAGLLVGLAGLTKYFAVSLVPLMLVYALARERRVGPWLVAVVIPVAMFAGYQWLTFGMYGRGLLRDAAGYASMLQGKDAEEVARAVKVLIGVIFTGGAVAPLLFFGPLLWSRRWLFAGMAFAALTGWALYVGGSIGPFKLISPDGSVRWPVILQAGVLLTVGEALLLLAGADLWEHRSAESLLLFLWVIGTVVFTTLINWTINSRSVLPLVPAAGILIVRRLRPPAEGGNWRAWLPLLPSAALALAVAAADTSLADAARSAARRVGAETTGKLWSEGHWGFQYYMQAAGAQTVDFKQLRRIEPGDWVAMPENNYALVPLPDSMRPDEVRVHQEPVLPWLATMNPLVGAGSYANRSGPLPFAFGRVPAETYHVYRVRGQATINEDQKLREELEGIERRY